MRAFCLFVVLVLAKALMLGGTHAPMAGWAPPAYFWEDALVAFVAFALDASIRRPRAGWVLYGALVLYIAWSVPITIVAGSPMTWAMIRAARGPLADSISHYITPLNIGRMLLVACVGAALPILLGKLNRAHHRRPDGRWKWLPIAAAAIVVLGGRAAASRIDTVGLDRNAVTALVPAALPAVRAATVDDWRASPLPSFADMSVPWPLTRLRGSGRGLNVLVVVLESTAAEYLRPYGGVSRAADDPMPNFTALAERAILFENAYATYPESIKGLFSTLCAQYPAFGLSPEAHAGAPCASIARELSRAGYQTALFHSGRFRYLGMDRILADKGFDLLEDAGAIGGNVRSSFGVDEPSTVNRLLGWIDARPANAPFFAMYLPVAGHHPYATPHPGPFRPDTEFDQYKNALHDADEALGSLLSGLRARHLDDHTVVLVMGDHGEAFGQHPNNIGHTFFIYDENVKVPYLIAMPGAEPARRNELVSLIDTAPTLLDVLGLPIPESYQGASLLQPVPRMALFFTDYSLGLLGLRDGCLKYVFQTDTAASRLFDVCRDPSETVDLAGGQAARVGAYHDRVVQWSAAQQVRIATTRR